MEESNKPKPIVEEREERMVSFTGGIPTLRIARFLNPTVSSIDEAMEVSHVSSLSSGTVLAKPGETWPMKVEFKGWRAPMMKWKQWVDKLVQIHEPIWRKTCIYDAIMASTYKVKKDKNLVYGLVELWCPETNTFVFPWGEATITLEDMLILGGFSVLGEPVTSPLDENLLKIKDMIDEERKKRPAICSWINHFMESEDDRDVEHIMFLVLWLSRYVFQRPPQELVGKHVFSIALHLAQGTRIALAPAVLSRLYRDLSILSKNVVVSNDYCDVWGMFHILHLWVWEHFPPIRPGIIHLLREGEPRIARWHDMKASFGLQIVRSVLKSSENFQWRCYATNVINWRHPSFYNENEMWVLNDSNIDDELQSFAQCLRASELVGIDCIEQYLPHRVAMQFGLDQDLPGCFTRANAGWDYAWKTYNQSIKKAAFYIPPRLFESDVTIRYLEWWKQSMRNHSEETTGLLLHQRRGMACYGLENEDREESHGSGPLGLPPKNMKHILQEDGRQESCSHELPISQSLKLLGNSTEVVNLPVTWEKPSSCTQSQTSPPLMILSNTETRGRSSTAIAEKNASTVIGEKSSSCTQSQTSPPLMILSNTETRGRSSTAITEKNAFTVIEDKPSSSNGSGPPGLTSKNKKHTLQEDIKLESWNDDIDKLPISQSLKPLSNNTKVANLPFTWEKRSSRSTRHRTSLPKLILGKTETKGKSSTVITEKNASTRGDTIGGSTQNDLGVERETVTCATDQSGELEDRVLKLEKYFAEFKAMKAKVELKKTTKS